MAATFEESLMTNMTAKREELRAALHWIDPASVRFCTYCGQYVPNHECEDHKRVHKVDLLPVPEPPYVPAPSEAEMSTMAQLVDVPYELAQHTPRCTQEYADSCLSREEWIERLNDEFER